MLWNSFVRVKCWKWEIRVFRGKKSLQICFCHVKRMNALSRMDAQQWTHCKKKKNAGMKMSTKGISNRRKWREHFRLNTKKNYIRVLTFPEYLHLIGFNGNLFRVLWTLKQNCEFRRLSLMHVFSGSPDGAVHSGWPIPYLFTTLHMYKERADIVMVKERDCLM